jgi:hypothetical protein
MVTVMALSMATVNRGMISLMAEAIIREDLISSPSRELRTPVLRVLDFFKARCGMHASNIHLQLPLVQILMLLRTMTVIHSNNVLLQDIYVSSKSTSGTSSVNTDGADTIYADNITFNRWTVRNGDDAISPKANSSNILITNSIFYDGSGIALGSIGQYNGVFETIENVTAENITCIKTLHAVYFKTFTGEQVGYPPNGGGGGLGCKYSPSIL